MGILSHRVKRSKVKEGDHIYTWRAAFTYSHHGIYIGEGKVVHFTPNLTTTPTFPISSSSSAYPTDGCVFPDCSSRQPSGGVTVSCIDCFTGSGSLYSYDYYVSSLVFLSRLRGGTCTTAKPDPPQDAVHRAIYLVRTGFGTYDVLRNNCEDFALYCKTGLVVLDRVRSGVGGSGQVMQASSFLGAPVTALASYPLAVLGPSPLGVAAVAGGVYYMSGRYAMDMGVRRDVVKVGVKDLALDLGWLDDQGFIAKESTQSI